MSARCVRAGEQERVVESGRGKGKGLGTLVGGHAGAAGAHAGGGPLAPKPYAQGVEELESERGG
eukprot:1158012-Pelagomonas_calceolata.AAC.7